MLTRSSVQIDKMPFSAMTVMLGLMEHGGFALVIGKIYFGLRAGGMQRMILYLITG